MSQLAITEKTLERLAQSIRTETSLPVFFEIQEDGKFLLVSVEGPADELLGERIAALVSRAVPERQGEDAWMVVFIQNDQVVDSYF